MLRNGGVVGAEELLNLDACQAAVPSPLSEPRHGLRGQQSIGSDRQTGHLQYYVVTSSLREMQEILQN